MADILRLFFPSHLKAYTQDAGARGEDAALRVKRLKEEIQQEHPDWDAPAVRVEIKRRLKEGC
jgi:hypothetical protein